LTIGIIAATNAFLMLDERPAMLCPLGILKHFNNSSSVAIHSSPSIIETAVDNLLYNQLVSELPNRLDRVQAQLLLYEHPLLNFSARAKGEGVEIIIQFKDAYIPIHTYYFDLHPRDLDHPQFEWSFQRQLYDALHDYFCEMFIRTPQDRADRRRKGL
jgi:hypothetical protein